MKVDDNDIQKIFDHWNSQPTKWKKHRDLSYEIRDILRKRLKQYSLQDLIQAIDNYAFIVHNEDYKMAYLWTLYQFMTRHRPNFKEELQLYRFMPNNFSLQDFQLSYKGEQKREAEKYRRQSEARRIKYKRDFNGKKV